MKDHLAKNLVDDKYQPLNTYFPDKEVNPIKEMVPRNSNACKLYFDGAVNAKGVGIMTILI